MFKHTGIVRRIDDIGRISIPKEVRRRFRLHDGDPIEIGESENMIVLRKYSVLELFDETTQKLITIFSKITDMPVILCNSTHALCSTMRMFSISRAAEQFKNVSITTELSECIRDGKNKCIGLKISEETEQKVGFAERIIINGATEGVLIIPESKRRITDEHKACLRFCASAISSVTE